MPSNQEMIEESQDPTLTPEGMVISMENFIEKFIERTEDGMPTNDMLPVAKSIIKQNFACIICDRMTELDTRVSHLEKSEPNYN